MTGAAPRTALVIVNYGSAELIAANYAALGVGSVGARIIVVDNRKSRPDTDAIRELCRAHRWTLLENASNLGFGAASNIGVHAALGDGCDVVILANPDLRMTLPVIAELAAACRTDPDTAVSPIVLQQEGRVWFSGGLVLVDEGRTTTRAGSDSAQAGGWLAGTCVAVHASLWTRAGGFAPEYFLYWEDVDLSWRIAEVGGALRVRPDLTVVHAVGGTQGSEGKSPLYVRYNCRNRLLFAAQHLDAAQQRLWVRTSARYAKNVLLRGGRRSFVRRAVPLLWAATAGTLAGLRELRTAAVHAPGRLSQAAPRP